MKKIYIAFFLIMISGMTLCQMLAAIIYGFSDGTVLHRIAEMPHLANFISAVLTSALLYFSIFKKM